MVKFRPTNMCCGCLSLLVGVELICLLHLINCVSIIAVTSSRDTLYIYSMGISPTWQVLMAAWAFLGIPVVIGAGVGALYRIEFHLRLYVMYMAVSLVFGAFFTLNLLVKGAMCSSVATQSVQRMGSVFVCGFMDAFQFFWMLIIGLIHLYFMYVVWSAAEEVAQTAFPELLRYTDALRAVKAPVPPKGPKPIGSRPAQAFPYAAPAPGTPLLAPAQTPQEVYQATPMQYQQATYQETPTQYQQGAVRAPRQTWADAEAAEAVQTTTVNYRDVQVGYQTAAVGYETAQARSSLQPTYAVPRPVGEPTMVSGGAGTFQSFIPMPPSSIQQ